MEAPTTWVFRAGSGALPPALTGRTAEQAVLRRCLAGVSNGEAPPHDVVLLGPRGNGKTALLRWFESVCTRNEPAVDVASLTPSALPGPAALVDALAPRLLAKLLPRKVGIATIGSAEWTRQRGRRNLAQALASRCRRRPLVVLLDEAHTLDPSVGNALLNASQQVRGAEAPFLLVLAGTPGLPAHLAAMDASFWSRLGEGKLGIGRLSEDAARRALTEPLREHGVDIDLDALAWVVAESQCYPYFVQLWGEALWQRHTIAGANAIDAADAQAVALAVAAQVGDYYQQRFVELESENLVPAAVALAKLFEHTGAAEASDREVDAALAEAATEPSARAPRMKDPSAGAARERAAREGPAPRRERFATREALNRLGYIWQPPMQQAPVRWQPGIPSLMAHVLRQAACG